MSRLRSFGQSKAEWHTVLYAAALLLGLAACKERALAVATAEPADGDPAEVSQIQDATGDPDTRSPDASPDLPVALQDATTEVGDTADADGLGTGLDPVCVADLPVAGEPCAKVGEIRCTNLGAAESQQTLYKFCARPNFVRCATTERGKAAWQLEACPGPVKGDTTCHAVGQSCLIWKGEHFCSPTHFDLESPNSRITLIGKTFGLGFTKACPNHYGKVECLGGEFVSSCTTLAETGELAADLTKAFGKCAEYAKKIPLLLPSKICLEDLKCPCIKPPGAPPGPWPCKIDYQTACMSDPATGQPRCQETCKEVGAPGY